MAGNNLRISGRGLADLEDDLRLLLSVEVLVGVPDEKADRDDLKDGDITNAALAYIHDNGAPEVGIPARPFMRPGIRAAEDRIADKMGQTMRAVLRGGGPEAIEKGMAQVGFIASVSVQRTINEGVPPPLSDYTLRQRMRAGRKNGAGARKGAAQELDRRWDGQAPSVEFAKPLVDTGQLRNSITYAVRSRKKRGR